MPAPKAPKTTPECKRLENIVVTGVKSTPFEADKKEAARAALRRICKKRYMKSLEYIVQLTSERNIFDAFGKEIFDKATKCLNDLS